MQVMSSAPQVRSCDFMLDGYLAIQEPLNLLTNGQGWFARLYRQASISAGNGLVLGATPWLAALLARYQRRVVVADMSPPMLELASQIVDCDQHRPQRSPIDFVVADWRRLPSYCDPLAVVVGDNSLSFLRFPDEWADVLDDLASRMVSGARIMIRVCSVPPRHRPQSARDIVDHFLRRPSINYTEVRATWLFAHWNRQTFGIDTAAALASFEAHLGTFAELLDRPPADADNDLLTMRKYRKAGAVYFAPPLADIIDVVGRPFAVQSVHFGPYAMADYFPLIIATKE